MPSSPPTISLSTSNLSAGEPRSKPSAMPGRKTQYPSPSTRTTSFRDHTPSWAGELNRLGYAVLMVDSHWPRGIGSTCSLRVSDPAQWMNLTQKRERDAYGALQFLRAQAFVRPDRIGIIGWSQGGGVVLLSTRVGEAAR